MKARVKIKLNNSAIKTLEQAKKQATEMTAEAILSDIKTSVVVPKQTGELERSGFIDPTGLSWGACRIIFDTPYARRLYWHPEYDFRKDKNPMAQGKWMHAYLYGRKKNYAKDIYKKFLKQLSKGLVK
ncbi:hypothetical protein CPAST_c40300 [Clostridium pasteurianum DSM 525 = ATCC 6013]|uniref:Minor capsid protein n=1 Tax=Clostridium pasteurianum DSM 525 = ATCC 6013 TaxID=1262449 RepID=A0A0H3J968_CLOPA|nr:minor capsid protein [Clostridium pasteurianum]AJA50059.1 hypothetical protein CPAST_c40300 [Clostridium pasteurianum DSM 525 = ATCC 6013]AJA54047.1 hypothetical protein CLPA_c40300 [Clostridium pasteurianum DSM 525 = ATCC 6013]AOZ77185.1 hypothetical protein AQ983_19595 [Clostridium pasteurianum DSM 525 = ATCC 6013]AOZ80982.1 hypothetical protein AQ984_19590 [Clostridium pasteurianum]ELP59236.1 hypothetical protein F502_10158 [Clostridium pasteurianum DSM 525 = ATCC 6013]